MLCLCLMDNHYHLLIETPKGNLSQIMRGLNGRYTRFFNKTRQQMGHVFQGRYKALIVQKDSYLLELSRYLQCVPVKLLLQRIIIGQVIAQP